MRRSRRGVSLHHHARSNLVHESPKTPGHPSPTPPFVREEFGVVPPESREEAIVPLNCDFSVGAEGLEPPTFAL